jgi:FMN phosphatase YigB (HAD superfamily)
MPCCRLVIVTNGMTMAQTGRVEGSAIRDCISALFISQSMGCQKPQRAFYELVYAALGLTEKDLPRTVMVGDSLTSDILGGINGGIDTVWYNPGHQPGDPQICPTWEAADFQELERILLGIQ